MQAETVMDVEAYLARIGYQGTRGPDLQSLRCLHRAHMQTVPFENLDIVLGRPIVLSLPAIYQKVVSRGRGGFCYELNSLFGWLLQALGYKVSMLSARVYGSDGEPGPDFDHMLLLVEAEGLAICDVGFGESFVEPLLLQQDTPQQQGANRYRLCRDGDHWVYSSRRLQAEWQPQFRFPLTAQPLDAFFPMCHYNQTSPESSFTRKSVCSRAREDGRVTLSNGRLIRTINGEREQQDVKDETTYRQLLARHFSIDLGPDTSLENLLHGPPQA